MRVVLWNVRIRVGGWLRGRTNVNELKRRWEEGTNPRYYRHQTNDDVFDSFLTSSRKKWRSCRGLRVDDESCDCGSSVAFAKRGTEPTRCFTTTVAWGAPADSGVTDASSGRCG